MSERDIIIFITDYVRKCGGRVQDWYCGIASKPEDRLFIDHRVSRKYGYWVYKAAENALIARNTEQYLIGAGLDGGSGGGDDSTIYVYAYRKTSSTVE